MRNFIKKMREAGLVEDIERPVSTEFEAAKISAGTNKLVYLHNLDGHEAVMNLLSSRKALSVALGYDEKDIVKNLAKCEYNGKVTVKGSLSGIVSPVDADLTALPILKHFPKDAGRYLT
ncbi:MAG: UbiD family decarboxylase, partial [Methanomicrobium sp.]|nr:UbiD family decarboxylase [Methanomicrobium sp.]